MGGSRFRITRYRGNSGLAYVRPVWWLVPRLTLRYPPPRSLAAERQWSLAMRKLAAPVFVCWGEYHKACAVNVMVACVLTPGIWMLTTGGPNTGAPGHRRPSAGGSTWPSATWPSSPPRGRGTARSVLPEKFAHQSTTRSTPGARTGPVRVPLGNPSKHLEAVAGAESTDCCRCRCARLGWRGGGGSSAERCCRRCRIGSCCCC
jgi:hypothetical protein